MSTQEKATPSNDAQLQLKERTDELIDSGEYALDAGYLEEYISDSTADAISKGRFSSGHRKKLENYLDECRLRREIADDFDF